MFANGNCSKYKRASDIEAFLAIKKQEELIKENERKAIREANTARRIQEENERKAEYWKQLSPEEYNEIHNRIIKEQEDAKRCELMKKKNEIAHADTIYLITATLCTILLVLAFAFFYMGMFFNELIVYRSINNRY